MVFAVSAHKTPYSVVMVAFASADIICKMEFVLLVGLMLDGMEMLAFATLVLP